MHAKNGRRRVVRRGRLAPDNSVLLQRHFCGTGTRSGGGDARVESRSRACAGRKETHGTGKDGQGAGERSEWRSEPKAKLIAASILFYLPTGRTPPSRRRNLKPRRRRTRRIGGCPPRVGGGGLAEFKLDVIIDDVSTRTTLLPNRSPKTPNTPLSSPRLRMSKPAAPKVSGASVGIVSAFRAQLCERAFSAKGPPPRPALPRAPRAMGTGRNPLLNTCLG